MVEYGLRWFNQNERNKDKWSSKTVKKMATSSIRIKKICQWCGAEFEAQKVSTKYCSHRCANLAYKQATREKRVKRASPCKWWFVQSTLS